MDIRVFCLQVITFDSKDYAIPYQAEDKPVIKIGVSFLKEIKTVSDREIVKD